jgi:hypothetical protein
MDTQLPICAKDKTENAEPDRTQLLSENDDARCIESSTESFFTKPTLAIPWIEVLEPHRRELRRDIADPMLMKSMTESAEPSRVKLRKLKLLPI